MNALIIIGIILLIFVVVGVIWWLVSSSKSDDKNPDSEIPTDLLPGRGDISTHVTSNDFIPGIVPKETAQILSLEDVSSDVTSHTMPTVVSGGRVVLMSEDGYYLTHSGINECCTTNKVSISSSPTKDICEWRIFKKNGDFTADFEEPILPGDSVKLNCKKCTMCTQGMGVYMQRDKCVNIWDETDTFEVVHSDGSIYLKNGDKHLTLDNGIYMGDGTKWIIKSMQG